MFQREDALWVPKSPEEIWAFFSNPQNLARITPPEMGFDVHNTLPNKMYAGMMIHHKVKPLAGIPLSWITEITHVQEGQYFVDEQRFGPFAMWHHEHHFEAQNGGTLIRDLISYKLPLGGFGALFHSLLVKPKMDAIFEFRRKTVTELFGTSC